MGKRLVVALTAVLLFALPSLSISGGPTAPARYSRPPLDHSLMGFKEQGVWYFLCTAPHFPHRIPPHYQTYGPPPPPCVPMPCEPRPVPPVRK